MSETPVRTQLHRPRVADVVADNLRRRILDGEVPDGERLPKQDQLSEEFGVSLPSMREALRILETEGLLTVMRGSTGGAIVRTPSRDKVSYMMALVLQADGTTLDDVAKAIHALEPVCALMAAARPDRAETIVPTLRANIAASEAAFGDTTAYVTLARQFHEQLAAGCGSQSFQLMVGVFEQLWSAHVREMAVQESPAEAFEDLDFRRESLACHIAIVDAIEAGDTNTAAALVGDHMNAPELYPFIGTGQRVEARHLRSL